MHTQGEESAVDELAAIQRKMSNTKVAKARAAPKEAAERASLGKTIAQVGIKVNGISKQDVKFSNWAGCST